MDRLFGLGSSWINIRDTRGINIKKKENVIPKKKYLSLVKK